ncbi:Ig-like domain-containing protein [uncultured Bacteroides sp.]|uniref:Ig-like domain-containing protein n=1 Tax=uncultured Bacteroides sp. TaxID=162156 RepID=UPI00280C0DA9|nr:Ig-like domain-containing protein [uncultured Bacteroides sp.]
MSIKNVFIVYLSAVVACLLFACGGNEGGKEDPIHIGVSSVELSETSYTMIVGDSLSLKAIITPSDATDQKVNWDSSEETVAVVSSKGVVFAVGEGTCVITASVDGKTAKCTITVQKEIVSVESIILSEDALLLGIGDRATLIATIRPDDATECDFVWTSSNQEVATVSNEGKVVAILAGTCTITVTAGGKSASCTVTVNSNVIPVKEVVLSASSLTLKEGESHILIATVTPSDATEQTVTWKSGNPDIATVSDQGKIEAIHAGTCVITASSGGKVSECVVTVLSKTIEVEQIALSSSSLSLKEGESQILTAAIIPNDATERTVSWSSSDPSVATVSSSGEVTAIRAGSCTIKASAGGKSASCTVTVTTDSGSIEVAVEQVVLSSTSLSLKEGESQTLTATVTPDDATEGTVSWSSSNPSVATVSSSGKVTAVGAGSCTIKASAGGKSASCTVTVSAKVISVQKVILSFSSLSLKEGESQTLTATVKPDDATEGTVSWSSSNPSVATVSSSGKVTAVGAGSCTIKASAGGKSASCTVRVQSEGGVDAGINSWEDADEDYGGTVN